MGIVHNAINPAQRRQITQEEAWELVDSIKKALSIFDAVRFTVGLGETQLERIQRVHDAVARAEGR